MRPWIVWLVLSLLSLKSAVIAARSTHNRVVRSLAGQRKLTHTKTTTKEDRSVTLTTQAGEQTLVDGASRPLPLPVRTKAGQRELSTVHTNHRPDPRAVRTRAAQGKLATASTPGQSNRAVPLPVRTQAGQRKLATGTDQHRPIPLPVRTQAGQRKLATGTNDHRPIPLPVRTQAGQRRYLMYLDDTIAVSNRQDAALSSRHRRLGQDKNPAPTIPPTKKDDAGETVSPTVGPLEETTPFPSMGPRSLVPDFESPTTLRPSTLAVSPPVLNENDTSTTNDGTSSTEPPLPPDTNDPSELITDEDDIDETMTDYPSPSPTVTPPTVTIPLASFDVEVVATLDLTLDRADQLRLYRKVIRTSLQTYLTDSLASTTASSSNQTSSNDLVHVLLRVVETRTSRRSLQGDDGTADDAESDGLTTVQQVFSYAGDAVFFVPAPPDATPSLLQQQQALALSLTSDVQQAIDASFDDEMVTVQVINMWEPSGDASSETPQSSSKRFKFGSNTSIVIGSVVGVVALLALSSLFRRRKFCQHHWRHPAPPPLITATTKKQPVELPFSPYGKEDDDRNHQQDDIQRIVSDLECLEESWHDRPPPSGPYLQLSGTGATSTESSKGSVPYTMASMELAGLNATASPICDGAFITNATPSGNNSKPVTVASILVDSRTTKGSVEMDNIDKPAKILAVHKIAEEKKEEERAIVQPSLYASPVIAMSGSGDSMDGYSLHSGFYGATAGCQSAPSARINSNLLQDFSPSIKTRPPWMTAPRISDIYHESSTEEYTSDSESQFSYNSIGAIAKATIKSGMLGPSLHSMSMDSDDTSPSYSNNNDEMMLTLNRNPGGVTLADSPSFQRSQLMEHVYTSVDRDTPTTTNNSYLPAPYSAGQSFINASDYDGDGDSDDDPLRTAALSQPAKAAGLESYRSASHALTSPFSAAANHAMPPQLSSPNVDRSELESQPSDEMMDDSMAQDLEGFADELARIKRDIGLSNNQYQTQVENTPVARWGTTSSHHESGAVSSSTLVTPDDESRIVSSRRRNF